MTNSSNDFTDEVGGITGNAAHLTSDNLLLELAEATPDLKIKPEEEGQIKEAMRFYMSNIWNHLPIGPQAAELMKFELFLQGVTVERADILCSRIVGRLDAFLNAIAQHFAAR